jgi:uncharacterized membrane protein required for colicin V production
MGRSRRRAATPGECVDIVSAIRSLDLFDLLVVLFVCGFFVAGFMQGTLRRLIGLGILVIALLFALNLRDPLGSWLGQYWTQYPKEYSTMLAFGASFVVLYLGASIAAQVFYKRTQLFKRSTLVDEVLGGILGVLQAVLLVGAMIMILDSFFRIQGIAQGPNEIGFLRDIFRFYDPSQAAILFRDVLIPAFLTLFAWITPAGLRAFFG